MIDSPTNNAWQMQQQQLHYQQYMNSPSVFTLPSSVENIYGLRASSFESLSSNDSQYYQSRRRAMTKQRHHPYHSADGHHAHVNATPNSSAAMQKSSSSQSGMAVRRRISRACDQCNQLRTKCDGQLPCQHCVDFTLECKYARERKKRGKASRKDLQRAAEAAAHRGDDAANDDEGDNSVSPMGSIMEETPPPDDIPASASSEGSLRRRVSTTSARTMSSDGANFVHHHHLPLHQQTPQLPYSNVNQMNNGNFEQYSAFGQQTTAMEPPRDRHNQLHTLSAVAAQNMHTQNFTNEFMMMSPTNHSSIHNNMALGNLGVSPSLTGLMGHSPDNNHSPTWLSMPSPPTPLLPNGNNIKYPVLNPVLPHIYHIVSQNLACELLDLYFLNPSLSFLQPASPYVLTHVIRKKSFLHPTNPRVTSPALLAAMLWVAAQTSDAAVLSSSPSARGRICQKLLEVCINLLKPLVHIPLGLSATASNHSSENDNPGAGLSGLGNAGPQGREGVGAAGTLDDVLTYIHLGIVISASEFKGASLRWWHAAWSLARELRLNREVDTPSTLDADGENDSTYNITEEEREERRRTWWFLYIIDRHLALCYNRPLALLDIECIDLYLPLDDATWQKGDFFGAIGGNINADPFNGIFGNSSSSPNFAQGKPYRQAGPSFTVSGPGIFGFFLPVMVILGEIIDLHHARNHPRMGTGNGRTAEWDLQITEIQSQLELYGCSLRDWEASVFHKNNTKVENLTPETPGDGHNPNSGVSENSEHASRTFKPKTTEEIQTKIAVSYGTHAMHVMHILLSGKWDPISMLDDNDLWISSENFISSTAHAVSASEAVSEILQYDPDLSYMPYFFGIYLLQGSFLLLLIADKLQGEASQAVVGACETIVRAHEVCVVTLNTEYQRNFRKVMRSALSQVRGRGFQSEDMEEQKLKRREVLLLYRWCGDGRGLAL